MRVPWMAVGSVHGLTAHVRFDVFCVSSQQGHVLGKTVFWIVGALDRASAWLGRAQIIAICIRCQA